VQGDTWDRIAYKKLGGTKYTDQLANANMEHVGTLIFPAGVILRLPEVADVPSGDLPPWRR